MNLDKFRKARFIRPSETFAVPELKEFFDEDEEPVYHIHGLDANEQWYALEAKKQNSLSQALVKAIEANNQQEIIDVTRLALGRSEELRTHEEYAYRLELIRLGVTNGDGRSCLDYEDVARLGKHFPMIFFRLSTRILQLSGEGSNVGER